MNSFEAFLEYMRLLFKEKRLVESATNMEIFSEIIKDIKKIQESKSGGIPAKKKNGTLDLRYKKNIETLEKQKVI